MEIEQLTHLLSIGIVGVAVSMLVQVLKKKYGTSSDKTKIMLVLISLVAGALFYFLTRSPYYENVLIILGVASTFYAFLLKSK